MTTQEFTDIAPGSVFMSGQIENNRQGLFMTDCDENRMLVWAAKKGYNEDWVIYTYWADHGLAYCLTNGDKVQNEDNIKKLIPGCEEILNRYRH